MQQNRISRNALMIAVFLISSLFYSATQAQTVSSEQKDAVQKLIEDFDNPETPGGVVWVMRDGKVIFEKSFGMANLTHNIPFTPSTPTNIGSTSKQFTALAIALLEEKGLLSVDDDIRKYIPELPDFGDTVRIWHLLSHTSGYREYLNSLMMSGRQIGDPIRLEEIILLVQHQPELQNKPGEKHNYNNTGYALLAMTIERVTGEEFPDWMRENIFLPLGMTHTQVRKDPTEIIPGSAQGYSLTEDEYYTEVQDIYASRGAGGIYTTLPDLEKWILNFHNPVVGNPALIKKLQTSFYLNNGDTLNYGYGLTMREMNGLKMVGHDGADVAHRSVLVMFPEVKGAVITQSNNSSFPNQIAKKTAEIFFADVMEMDEDEEETKDVVAEANPGEFVYDIEKFDDLAGRYALEVAPDFILEFFRDGNKIMSQATGQSAFEIFPSSDSTFYLKVVEASITFHRNETGNVEQLTLHQNGHHKANKIHEPAWKPSEEDVKKYVGKYFSSELEAFYNIAVNQEGDLILQHRRINDLPLKAESEDEFTASFPIPNLKFLRNEQNEVTGFEAASGRSLGIVFEKQ
jgi:CubicO group peptidase (beta-lactamase class C family)